MDERDALRSQEIMKVIADSPLSYNEIVALIRTPAYQADDEDAAK